MPRDRYGSMNGLSLLFLNNMSPQTILACIVGITVASYFFNLVLEILNLRSQRKDIPDEVASFYDKEKYTRSLEYHHEQTIFSFITSGTHIGTRSRAIASSSSRSSGNARPAIAPARLNGKHAFI